MQEIPKGHRIGDVIYSLVNYSDEDGSFAPGEKGVVIGPADEDRDEMLKVQFEGCGSALNMELTDISRDSDPNSVSGGCCLRCVWPGVHTIRG